MMITNVRESSRTRRLPDAGRIGRRNHNPVRLPPPECDRVRRQAVAVDPHLAVQDVRGLSE